MVVTEGLFEQAWTYPDMLVGFSCEKWIFVGRCVAMED
jgi:hypothetical protein